MNRIYISRETDPYFNIAAEYQLLMEAKEGIDLFLWQNQPCIVIGRNQNLYSECNMEYLEKKQILPARRFSGGGAVFQDMGNLNFTFVTKEEKANPEQLIEIVKNAVSSLGIECSFSGRNDLLYEGKKISGHANYSEDGNYMYHGTMMVNIDLDMLTNVLQPSFIKLNSKGIDSVRSRVLNLSQINKEITAEKLSQAFINIFSDTYGSSNSIQYLNKENMKPPLWDKIRQRDWIFGEAPQFQIQVERKLSSGNITLCADVQDGLITRIKIHTDSLLVVGFSEIEEGLIGVLYQENKIFEMIDDFLFKKHRNMLR